MSHKVLTQCASKQDASDQTSDVYRHRLYTKTSSVDLFELLDKHIQVAQMGVPNVVISQDNLAIT